MRAPGVSLFCPQGCLRVFSPASRKGPGLLQLAGFTWHSLHLTAGGAPAVVLELASLLALLCFSFDGYQSRMQHSLPVFSFDPVWVFSALSCTLLPPRSGTVSAAPR